MIINKKRASVWNMVNRTRTGYFRWANGKSKTYLKKQIQPVLDKLPLEADQLSDNFIETVITEDAIKELLFQIYFTVGKKFAKSVYKGIIKSPFNEDAFAAQVLASIEIEGAELVTLITETTKREIKKAVSYGFETGASIQDTALLIQNNLQTMKLSRALTIARTETLRASNFGAMQGAILTGQELDKVWISTIDDVTRGQKPTDEFDHIVMDGVKADMNEPFDVGGELLMYPLDFNGSAGNIVNCRCTVGFQRKK